MKYWWYVLSVLAFLCLSFNVQVVSADFSNSSLTFYQNFESYSAMSLNQYSGFYGDLRLERFLIPKDVFLAKWHVQLMASDSCPETIVYFYLEHRGYPVIENQAFPAKVGPARFTKLRVSRIVSGKNEQRNHDFYLDVSSPLPGSWFSGAFYQRTVNTSRPESYASLGCYIQFAVSTDIWQMNDPEIVLEDLTVRSNPSSYFKVFKYLTESSYKGPLVFQMELNSVSSTETCYLTGNLRQSAIPFTKESAEKNLEYVNCVKSKNGPSKKCQMRVAFPVPNSWYYLALKSNCEYSLRTEVKSNCSISANGGKSVAKEDCYSLVEPLKTFRNLGQELFAVRYTFERERRVNSLTISEDSRPFVIEVDVDSANSGGTLECDLSHSLTRQPETPPANSTTTKWTSNTRVLLRACLSFNTYLPGSSCIDGYSLESSSLINQPTNAKFQVPYPQMGTWFLLVWKECYDDSMNENAPCPVDYAPQVNFVIKTEQCFNYACDSYASCVVVNDHSNTYSTCKCREGYYGDGYRSCTAIKRETTDESLAGVLFLTLSNLMFLLPICVAIYRRWYIEALIYFYNMFFSTFYHACDQNEYKMCIFNYNGLQLADFISSYSSFVMTLLSTSLFSRSWKVFGYIVGILTSLSVNLYDRFDHVAFIVILILTLTVTVSTWVRACYVTRKFYPKKSQLIKYYVPGLFFGLIGLAIFAFLTTKKNYWILHSIWHMCMATAVVFFLPMRKKPTITTASESEEESLPDVATITSSFYESTVSMSSLGSVAAAANETNEATSINMRRSQNRIEKIE